MRKSALKAVEKESFYSREGYFVHMSDARWRLSKDVEIPISSVSIGLDEKYKYLKQVLSFYAKSNSAYTVQNLFYRFKYYLDSVQGMELFSVDSLISFRSMLDNKHEWNLGVLRTLIRRWDLLGCPGVPSDSLALLDKWTLKGNEKGFAVQSMCPEYGPLTDIEISGVVAAVISAYGAGRISLIHACFSMLLAMTGRRPGQITALKAKDLIRISDSAYAINFPRAKQRNQLWRSEYNRISINEDLYLLVCGRIEEVKAGFYRAMGFHVPVELVGELPLFPHFDSFDRKADLKDLLAGDFLHAPTESVGRAMKRVENEISVISERTGEIVRLSPMRFRYTLGTNLAREGYGEAVIAEALDHSDQQNVGVYVRNIPEIVERIDKAVALQLAPIAQAFRGLLVKNEGCAQRGDDPCSRISNGNENVGTCGSYGFCGALAPVACYTCNHFQPWIDGPHEEVLDQLIRERDNVLANGGDLKVASVNDRLILAVSDVVNRCRSAKEQAVDG